MCQHTSAYVSIRQHTSAYVSIRQHTNINVMGRCPVNRSRGHGNACPVVLINGSRRSLGVANVTEDSAEVELLYLLYFTCFTCRSTIHHDDMAVMRKAERFLNSSTQAPRRECSVFTRRRPYESCLGDERI
jgi:hypothetical protein